jgi:hypothetical protein
VTRGPEVAGTGACLRLLREAATALPGIAAPGFWQRMARGLHRIASWINPLR